MPGRCAVALILARAGSKGVPRKNAAVLAGKPCVAWTLEAAISSETILHAVLTTDDPELASIARAHGAAVVDRPPALATDTARIDDAARHAVESISSTLRPPASAPVVILYGNVPVRPAGLIDRAVRLMLDSGCDSVQSYSPVGKFHPWWTARLDDDGRVTPWEGSELNHGVFRRQDLPPAFIPDGGVLVVSRAALFLEVFGVKPGPHAFFGRDRRGVLNPEGSVIDIDSPMDLVAADLALKGWQS
jgi:N-acylneuraminate cytidylyltransferase